MRDPPSPITVKGWPVADLAYMWLPPGSGMFVVPGKAMGGLFAPASGDQDDPIFHRFASWVETALVEYWEIQTPGTRSTWIDDPHSWGASSASGPKEGQILRVTEYGRSVLSSYHGPTYFAKVVRIYGTGNVRVQLLTKDGRVKRKATILVDELDFEEMFEPVPEDVGRRGKFLFVYNPKWTSGFMEIPGPRMFAESIEKVSIKTFGIPRYRAEMAKNIGYGEAGYRILETF